LLLAAGHKPSARASANVLHVLAVVVPSAWAVPKPDPVLLEVDDQKKTFFVRITSDTSPRIFQSLQEIFIVQRFWYQFALGSALSMLQAHKITSIIWIGPTQRGWPHSGFLGSRLVKTMRFANFGIPQDVGIEDLEFLEEEWAKF